MEQITEEQLKKLDFDSMSNEELDAFIEKAQAVYEANTSINRIAYFKPYPWQERFLQLIREKNTVFVAAPNKLGKSAVAICIAISWVKGYEPWAEVDKDYLGAIKVGERYYKPSSLGIKPPVNIVICGEKWVEQIGKTLVPELHKWAPAGEFEIPRKNEQGIESFWVHKNKSTITFMCYTQEDKVFESSTIQGALLDEPPPRPKYEGLKRGLYYDRGKTVITATPLSEVWMMDEFILKKDPDVGVITGLTIYDNPEKYNNEKHALMKMGMNGKQIEKYFELLIYDNFDKKICVKDQGRKAENFVRSIVPAELQKYIQELDILRFVKSTHPDRAPARFHGTFRALVGKIFKEFDREKHIIPARPIKPDWIIVPYIDWHSGNEIAIGFIAVTEHDMFFVIDEIYRNMNPYEVSDIIINRKIKDKWRIQDVFIDAFARGDVGYIRNRQDDGRQPEDTFAIIERKLRPHGMKLIGGSRDRDSGITNIETRLRGPNDIPTLYFYDSLQSNRGAYGHLLEIERWTRDDNGKIKEEFNHFLVGMGWVTLAGIKYAPLKPRRQYSYTPASALTGY